MALLTTKNLPFSCLSFLFANCNSDEWNLFLTMQAKNSLLSMCLLAIIKVSWFDRRYPFLVKTCSYIYKLVFCLLYNFYCISMKSLPSCPGLWQPTQISGSSGASVANYVMDESEEVSSTGSAESSEYDLLCETEIFTCSWLWKCDSSTQSSFDCI